MLLRLLIMFVLCSCCSNCISLVWCCCLISSGVCVIWMVGKVCLLVIMLRLNCCCVMWLIMLLILICRCLWLVCCLIFWLLVIIMRKCLSGLIVWLFRCCRFVSVRWFMWCCCSYCS